MDTLHPGNGRLIQRIPKELGQADSENLRSGPPDLSQVPKEDENPHFYRGRRGDRGDPILLGCYQLFPLVVINSNEWVGVRTCESGKLGRRGSWVPEKSGVLPESIKGGVKVRQVPEEDCDT